MRIGIIGGTFDPFHSEHRFLIEKAHEELALDRVIVVPSFSPPHKASEISSFEARYAMVTSATRDLAYVSVDTIERERNCVNPAFEVLPLLLKKYIGEVFYIIGGDSMVDFHTWKHPEIIAKTVKLAVIRREGYDACELAVCHARDVYFADVTVLPSMGKEVSSSVIKATVALGLVPQNIAVETYEIIREFGLYRKYDDLTDELKKNIGENTYGHCVRCVLFAMKYCTRLHLNYDEVFLSALLHDCAKHTKVEMEGVPSPVVHQFLGEKEARERYGIDNINILEAIKYHTTGKPDMTGLQKLIFCADMLESGRDFEGVEKLRKVFDTNFDEGFYLCVKSCVDHLISNQKPIYYLTKECEQYYNKNYQGE